MSDVVTLGETMAVLAAPRAGRLRDMKSLRLSAAGSSRTLPSAYAGSATALRGPARRGGRARPDDPGVAASRGSRCSRSVIEPSVQTALMFKERRGPNVARVTYYRRGYAGSRLSIEDLDESLISAGRVLHVTGITLALSETARAAAYRVVEIARSAAVPVSFDFSYRSALWTPEEAAGHFRSMAAWSDLVFAGEEELAIVAPGNPLAGARRLAEGGNRAVVVKRRPRPVLSHRRRCP